MENLELFVNFPNTASSREIQRNYRSLFNRVKKTHQPLLVISNNQPDVAVVSIDDLTALVKQNRDYETQLALFSIAESRRQWKAGESKVLTGEISSLWDEGE